MPLTNTPQHLCNVYTFSCCWLNPYPLLCNFFAFVVNLISIADDFMIDISILKYGFIYINYEYLKLIIQYAFSLILIIEISIDFPLFSFLIFLSNYTMACQRTILIGNVAAVKMRSITSKEQEAI